MIVYIWSTSGLWEQIRRETAPFVKVRPGKKILSLTAPPQVALDAQSLRNSCSLLSACFKECLKQCQMTIQLIKVRNSFHLDSSDVSNTKNEMQNRSLKLEIGTIVVTNISQFRSTSDTFKTIATSHLDREDRAVKPNDTMIASVLSIVAGVIALWDITPADSEALNPPKTRANSPFIMPAPTIRTLITQRHLEEDIDTVGDTDKE